MKTAMRIVRRPTVVLVCLTGPSFHTPTPPAIENTQQVATVLEDRNRQPAKPRCQISDEVDRLLDVAALELIGGNGVKVWKDVLMRLDHLDLERILLPALVRHVGIDLVEDQMVFVLIVTGCGGERRQ